MAAVTVVDAVLRAVEADLGSRPPERGGALLGPPGAALVLRFLPDPDARATSATWAPSRALAAAVRQAEAEEGLELKGLVHSHPPGLDRPSEQDVRELAEGLRRNPHLASYLAPVVTQGRHEELGPHELALRGGKISFYAGSRAADGGADARPVRPRVLALLGDLERAARELGASGVEAAEVDLGTGPLPAARALLPDGRGELLAVAPASYPATAPALFLARGGALEQLEAPWRLQDAEGERLARAVRGAGVGDRDALFARTAGLLPRALSRRRVLVAGCGSVGSYLAEGLARAGVGALALVDPEAVEAANLSRTPYAAADVGAPKVEALARRLRAASPGAEVAPHARAVEAFEPAALDREVRAADLVVAATDDPSAQRALNRFAYARGRPALFVGLYAGAQGGEVVLSVPGRTPCYLCATRARHALGAAAPAEGAAQPPGASGAAGGSSPAAEYGTGRLPGEPALAADIQHVASAALKLGLSLLSAGEAGASLGGFAERALREGTPYLTMSTVPDYWFYPRLFEGVPGQLAYQSVWMGVEAAPDCPVCGPDDARVDPLAAPLNAPSRDAFAGLAKGS